MVDPTHNLVKARCGFAPQANWYFLQAHLQMFTSDQEKSNLIILMVF